MIHARCFECCYPTDVFCLTRVEDQKVFVERQKPKPAKQIRTKRERVYFSSRAAGEMRREADLRRGTEGNRAQITDG